MRVLPITHGTPEGAAVRPGRVASLLQAVGRFVMHYLEMCIVMCVGTISLSVLFFGGAALLGHTDLPQRAPALTALVIALNLSLPMAASMRYMGMEWRPTLEMSGSTMLAGLLLIAAYWLDLIAKGTIMELQTGLLACPLMLVVMLFRYRLYSTSHRHQAHAVR